MRNCYKYLAFLLMAHFLTIAAFAQNLIITGNVKNSKTQEFVPAVSILVKGTNLGTFTDDKGNFKITVSTLPVILSVSSIGYENKEVTVSSAGSQSIELAPSYQLGEEVVVAASRTPERILESPVSIERVSSAAIRNTAATSYYDILGNLKGVDLVIAGLLFKTPSTRGFNTSGNLRLNQLVDGMDNQAPGLNFAVGTLSGITELDVDNMELLAGASSALYGPGGMNGTLLINSKNPFKYQGLSWQVKQGIMHVDNHQRKPAPFYDWTVRWGKQVSEKFAFKIGGEFTQTKDWLATDSTNYDRGTNPASGKVVGGNRTDPAYNGVNVYGDETLIDIRPFILGALGGAAAPSSPLYPRIAPLLGSPINVTRTGYTEAQVIDPTTLNIKLDGALHYKITNGTEASLTAYFGYGSTVYTGSDRYSLRGVKIGQYKLEVRNKNWFARAYTTQEDAGESFNASATTALLTEAWKPSYNSANQAGSWAPQYTQAFLTALSNPAVTYQQAHNSARAFADVGRPVAGTPQFTALYDAIRSKPISKQGGLFLDKSNLYMTEGQYNFSDVVKVAEVVVGADVKQYVLNSEGTLFADTAGRIKINETGIYAQVAKKFFDDRLKLTASGRYDKQNNFKGRFTPRFSAVIKAAENHNFRLSYQTAYRFPSTQNQWINLVIGGGVRLIGGLPQLRDFYNFNTNPVVNATTLQPQKFEEYKPESSRSYEVGYKGLVANKLLIDVYGYYSEYKNFLGRIVALQSPGTVNQKIFSVSVNSQQKVNTQGWGASVEYLLPANFSVNANLYSDEIKNVPDNFVAFFNAPKYRANIGLSNSGIFDKKRIGFNLTYHYQDEVYFEGDFGSGKVPSYMTLDGQISYKFPQTKSIIKLGATNILNKYYLNAFGNPQIGGLYYMSFGYNIF